MVDYSITDIGFSTADAERVRLSFDGSNLLLQFIDWQEQAREHRFMEVLGIQWNEELDDSTLRDDLTYAVDGSKWLARQAELAAVDPMQFVHYKLCFNACGVLDVLCRRGSEYRAVEVDLPAL